MIYYTAYIVHVINSALRTSVTRHMYLKQVNVTHTSYELI